MNYLVEKIIFFFGKVVTNLFLHATTNISTYKFIV